jgi:hypothetical protein
MADTHEQRLQEQIEKAALLAFELCLLETAKQLGLALQKCQSERERQNHTAPR